MIQTTIDQNVSLKSIDLAGASSGSIDATPWWLCLNDIVNECTSISTGEYNSLIINQGGIQNRISTQAKARFKNEVLPYLMTIACLDVPLTGHIEAQLAEGVLRKATLRFQCEEGHIITTPF